MSRLAAALFVLAGILLNSTAYSQSAPAPSGGKNRTETHDSSRQIDINRASSSELKSVPGIGDAYAAKIMAGRPYKNKAQLRSRGILPEAVYDKVKDRLVARQN